MTSVSSPQCSMRSSLPFPKEDSGSCMRIRDMTANRFAEQIRSGVYPKGRTEEAQTRASSEEPALGRGGGALLVQPVSKASGQI